MKNIEFTFSDYKREFEGNFNTKINGIKNILSIMDIKEVSNKTLEKIEKEWDYMSCNTSMTNYLNLQETIKNVINLTVK